jgi:hypothetical protein
MRILQYYLSASIHQYPCIHATPGHVVHTYGFVVAHRHLNLASLLKDHRFDALLEHELRQSGRSTRNARLPPLWSYWEVLLVHPGASS